MIGRYVVIGWYDRYVHVKRSYVEKLLSQVISKLV